jgi:ATP-dependent Clp protease ATP-binding subunit ClpA
MMPSFEQRLTAVVARLENGHRLGEALFFPEFSTCAVREEKLHKALAGLARQVVENEPPLDQYRRRWNGPFETGVVKVEVPAPQNSVAWRSAVPLDFHVVRWRQGDEVHLAYVPMLGIEVLAKDRDELDRALPREIRAAVERLGGTRSLEQLVWMARCRSIEIRDVPYTVRLRKPKERALRERACDHDEPKTLKHVADDMTRGPIRPAFEIEQLVAQLADRLLTPQPPSMLLVGPSGVGKTAVFRELVRRRRSLDLGGTPFWSTSGARLIAGMSGFGMWQERCQALVREAAKRKAVLHLGNLVELAEVGKCASTSEGIASFLRAHLVRGEFVAVAECTPEQWSLLEREEPQLLSAFERMDVEEPDNERGRAILLGRSIADAKSGGAALDGPALATLDRLHRRYATYSAYPGRPLRFLENLGRDHPAGSSLTASDVTRAFSQETGLPLFLLDDAVPLDLQQTFDWFARKVIGQDEAIDLVVGLLATIKAGLARPRRPLASLLFIGPTGVGKTEMAKALAEFLYQAPDRMVRFDMTEYADSAAVERLAGGAFGSAGLLTSKVREQPFGVILFDEFEKAHARFFDLLLQVLGEGRLTDAAGRVADCCNAVVIMTSNLGAESFQRAAIGFPAAGEEPAEISHAHFEKHVRQFLRPELFNRLDRIVAFAPLGEETLRSIAVRQLEQIRRRDGIQYSGVMLALSDAVEKRLAAQGHEPRYGARPLRRAIERHLLAPLAAALNRYTGDTAREAEVGLSGDDLRIAVRAHLDRAGRQLGVLPGNALAETAQSCAELRRSVQALERCSDVLDLTNEIVRLERIEGHWSMLRRKRPQLAPPPILRGLLALRRLAERLTELKTRSAALEEEALLTLYGGGHLDRPRHARQLAAASDDWQEFLLTMYGRRFSQTERILLAIYGEHHESVCDLCEAYRVLADRRGAQVESYRLMPHDRNRSANESFVLRSPAPAASQQPYKETVLDALRTDADGVLRLDPDERFVGIALVIRGAMVYPLLEVEHGLHAFQLASQVATCLVHVSEQPIAGYEPPSGIDRRGAIGTQRSRRAYDLERRALVDPELDGRLSCPAGTLADVLIHVVERRLIEAARALTRE